MFKLLFFLVSLSLPAPAQNVEAIGDKVLNILDQMSREWKKVKDIQSVGTAGTKSIELTKQLTILAQALKKLPQPDNKARTKIKSARAKKVEQVSMQMTNAIAMIMANGPLMSAFSIELKKIERPSQKNQKIFDSYFEPDLEPNSQPIKP